MSGCYAAGVSDGADIGDGADGARAARPGAIRGPAPAEVHTGGRKPNATEHARGTEPAMSTILVTGPSGFVGSHVVPELIAGGHRVVALVRNDDAGRTVLSRLSADQRPAVELRQGDVTRPETLPDALVGVDAVVHLVAIARDWNKGAELLVVNTEGTRSIVEAAKSSGVRRFLHLGALGVVDEPTLHYARSKAKAERIVAESGLDWTILKPSLLWGERDGFFNIVADLVRMSPGIVPVPGDGRSRFQPLAVRDLATIARLSLERSETIGRTYELGGPRYWTYREITREVCAAIGKRRAIVPMPVPLIRLVASSSELVHLPFPVASDQLRQLRLDNIGPLDTVEREFGFAPQAMEGQLGYLQRKKRAQEPAA
jgi:NADH dehydrogenase